MCSAHGREKSAGTGAGCQCPCHPLWWWLGIEGVHFLPLSATVCRHRRGCRWLQSSPPFCIPLYVSPCQRKKTCLLLPVLPLLPQATALAGDALLEKMGSCWVVGQMGPVQTLKKIQGGRAEVACVLVCLYIALEY